MSARYLFVLALCFVCGGAEPLNCDLAREVVVWPGATVTLECKCRLEPGQDVHWLKSCTPLIHPLVISTIKSIIEPIRRFTVTWNNRTGSVDLSITNITEPDLGIYYCAQVQHMRHQSSSGKLQESEVYQICSNTSTKLLYEAGFAPGNMACDCSQYWLVLCLVCGGFSVLQATVCMFFCCRQTETEVVSNKRRQYSGEKNNDTEVNYASLNRPKGSSQRTKRKISQNTEHSMYSELSLEHS